MNRLKIFTYALYGVKYSLMLYLRGALVVYSKNLFNISNI